MAQSIKPSYPIFPLTPFSQSLYSSRVNLSRPFVFRLTNCGEHPFDLGGFASSPSHSFSFIRGISFFRRRCSCCRSLSLDRHHTDFLYLSLSPLLFMTCSAPRFSSATPNRDSSDGCETDALPEFTPGLITILSLEGYEERASCLPACSRFMTETRPDARHAKWLVRVLGGNKISV